MIVLEELSGGYLQEMMGGLFFEAQDIKYPKLIPTIAPIIILKLFSNISNSRSILSTFD